MDISGTFGAMVKAVRNAGRPGAVGYAISAVDVALWDLKARLLDLPLHRLLGAVRDRVPVYGSGGFTAYDKRQLRDQLTHWALEQRIPRVKIKIGESWGHDPARDLERMHQARTIVGEDVELFVDANGGYARKQAIRVMRAAADLDVRWYEEPVSSDDLDGLREIRDAVRPDVTAGEYGYDLYYFRRMCAADAVDCLQADVSRCGGITEDQHPVGDLGAGGEHEPLRVGIRLSASRRDLDHFDACVGQDRVERRAELPGPVPDQEPETGGTFAEVQQEVPDLLRGPGPVRVGGHAEDVHVAGADVHHEQAVQALEGDRAVDVEEVGEVWPDSARLRPLVAPSLAHNAGR